MTTLLLPCAGRSSRYPGVRPKWTLTTPDGRLAIARAAASVEPGSVCRHVIAIRADHEARYSASAALRKAFADGLEILVLERETSGPAETVAVMIERAKVQGAIAIKDADSFFDPVPAPTGNGIALVDLRKNPDLTRVGAKSFAILNEQSHLAGIVEKEVASNFVSAGLYAFAQAAEFRDWFHAAAALASGEIFVSHVISEALRQGHAFSATLVERMVDVGTLDEWRRTLAQQRTLLVNVDGIVFEAQSEFFRPAWDDPVTPIQPNIDHLLRLQRAGAQLIFLTARREACRQATLDALQASGLSVFHLVMGCASAPQVLVNAFSAANPYPSATAVNLAADAATLDQYLS